MLDALVLPRPPAPPAPAEVFFARRNHCIWVRFETEDDAWVGVFDAGDCTGRSGVAWFDGTTIALVLAEGRAYAVDTATRRVRYQLRGSRFTDAIAIPGRDMILVSDDTYLAAFSSDSGPDALFLEYMALDGLRLDAATEHEVFGRVWLPAIERGGWYAFRATLDGWAFEFGDRLSDDWAYEPGTA